MSLLGCEVNRGRRSLPLVFFFNDTATTEIYTLSLHDALPISSWCPADRSWITTSASPRLCSSSRSEEHTSELQSHSDLVCRLLLEKKKKQQTTQTIKKQHKQKKQQK